MQTDEMNEIILAIQQHELSLARMYQEFAKSHPDHHQFWSQLAREEDMHAQWIESLGSHYHKGHIGKSGVKLNRQALRTSISHIEKQTESSRNGDLSLLNAVSIALDIEKSMIDKQFFEIFDLGDAKFDRIRAGLKKETLKHRQNLEKLFSELNQTQSSNSSKYSFSAPHSGQHQSSGRSSKGVPGGILRS